MAVGQLPAHLVETDRRARAAEPGLRRWFQNLAARLRAAATIVLVAESVRTGSTAGLVSALAAVAVPEPDLEPLVRDEARAALRLVTDEQPPSRRIVLRFDVHDPRFGQVAEQVGGRLIREIPDQVRGTVNRIVADAYRKGLHPYDFAPQIRATVGLTERQAVAVMNYAARLTERGASDEFVQKAAARYADRLLKQRSVLIARTETMRASNNARLLGWHEAAAHGLIEQATARLAWDAAMDRRTCAICASLDGTEAPLAFPLFDGNPPPPQHPDCRCVLQLL